MVLDKERIELALKLVEDPDGVSSVQVSDDSGATPTFTGTFRKESNSVVGFSFDYDFSKCSQRRKTDKKD